MMNKGMKPGIFHNPDPTYEKAAVKLHFESKRVRGDIEAFFEEIRRCRKHIDSLNQYAYRYLRKDDSFRSNCMIKMVIQMAKADFNPIRTERYTSELKSELERVSLAGSGENIEIEIIPFEVLWDIMNRNL